MKGNDNVHAHLKVLGWFNTPICIWMVDRTTNPIKQTY